MRASIILDEPQQSEPAGSGSLFSTWDIVRVVLILAAVICVIYAIFYALKKAGGGKFREDGIIRLIGSRSLGQNCAVHIIEAGAKYYLIGTSDGSVTHLADIDDKESVDEIVLKHPDERSGGKSFSDFFGSMFSRGPGKTPDVGRKLADNNKFMKDQVERLKKM